MRTGATLFMVCVIALVCIGARKPWRVSPDNRVVTLGFVGDTMIGRSVSPIIQQRGPAYVWGNLLPVLRALDLLVLNLETTLTRASRAVPKVFNFKSAPENVAALRLAGVDVVTLANNHAMDFGAHGLLETLDVLERNEIAVVGAGATLAQAQQPVIREMKGLKIGIVGFTDNEPGWLAGKTRPGINYCRVGDLATFKRAIQPYVDSVDILVATWHWGPNKREIPTDDFVHFAHQMIESGVDIIQGHSAHVVQGIEVYNNKLILYDTGDFVDDYIVGPRLRNDHSFLFEVGVTQEGITSVRLLPVLIDHMQVNRAHGDDFAQMVARMKRLCADFGTELQQKDGWIEVKLT